MEIVFTDVFSADGIGEEKISNSQHRRIGNKFIRGKGSETCWVEERRRERS